MNTLIENARLISTIAGMALTFFGERYFPSSPIHWWLVGVGFFFMTLGVLGVSICYISARKRLLLREAASWVYPILWQVLILCAFIFYYLYHNALGERIEPESLLDKGLLAAWVLMAVTGVFMGLGVEWAQANNGRGQYAEPQRVRLAAINWLKVGLLGVVIAAFDYTAVKKNVAWDVSYLKTSKPSDSTFQMIDGLSESVDAALFFPGGNEVLSKARLYFEEIRNRSPKLSIHFYDAEINPVAAEDYKVSRNGFVVLRLGTQTERFDLGLNLEGARKGLKNLDSEFQKALE